MEKSYFEKQREALVGEVAEVCSSLYPCPTIACPSSQWELVADFFLLESRGGLAGDKQIKSVAGECDCCTFLFLFMSLFWGVVACSGCVELTCVGGQ